MTYDILTSLLFIACIAAVFGGVFLTIGTLFNGDIVMGNRGLSIAALGLSIIALMRTGDLDNRIKGIER